MVKVDVGCMYRMLNMWNVSCTISEGLELLTAMQECVGNPNII